MPGIFPRSTTSARRTHLVISSATPDKWLECRIWGSSHPDDVAATAQPTSRIVGSSRYRRINCKHAGVSARPGVSPAERS